jgi:ADP-ribosyl-[dinitrogen reductase] hydrolase
MRSKPVDIGNTVRRGIMNFRNNGGACVAENEFDAGNGACMRCLPIALAHWNAPRELMNQASRIQAHVTHHNAVADAGVEAVLQMLVCAFNGESKSAMQTVSHDLVQRHKVFRYDRKRTENPSGWIVETLRTVFQGFFGHYCFESILIDIVNRGGDADTTGAIAGMLAGAFYGRHAIPKPWLKTLNAEVRRLCEEQTMELLCFAESQLECA